MTLHRRIAGKNRFHAPFWIGPTDPSSDPTNDVQTDAIWIDTTTGSSLATGWLMKEFDGSAFVTILDLATALAAKQALDAELTAIAGLTSAANKLIRFTGSGAADLLDFSTDGTMASNSDTKVPSEKAIRSYIASVITGGASNVMIFQGVIDCSANPNYPAADAGDVYKVSVAGRIGGASGPNVEVGDTLYCITDGTASGNHATVGAQWVIVQENIDGAVIGPASATSNAVALFDGTTGKLIKDSGLLFLLAALGDVNLGALSGGDVLTWDATSSKWINAAPTGGGGGGSRATVSKTTASLANNADENSTVALAKSGRLFYVQANKACRVILYATSAARTADAGRAVGVPPTPGTGVLCELIFSGSSTIYLGPETGYYNGDVSPTSDIYYRIVNLSGSTTTVQVDFTHLALES